MGDTPSGWASPTGRCEQTSEPGGRTLVLRRCSLSTTPELAGAVRKTFALRKLDGSFCLGADKNQASWPSSTIRVVDFSHQARWRKLGQGRSTLLIFSACEL